MNPYDRPFPVEALGHFALVVLFVLLIGALLRWLLPDIPGNVWKVIYAIGVVIVLIAAWRLLIVALYF